MPELIKTETIASKIFFIRCIAVMPDRDLAELYGFGTKRRKQAVRRHSNRFPPVMCLKKESEALREKTDQRFQVVFEVLNRLLNPENPSRTRIGFTAKDQAAGHD